MIIGIDDAIEVAAGAANSKISGIRIGRPATATDDRIAEVREIIKRFCENISPETTAEDILESLDASQ